jgi:hypothetical protein
MNKGDKEEEEKKKKEKDMHLCQEYEQINHDYILLSKLYFVVFMRIHKKEKRNLFHFLDLYTLLPVKKSEWIYNKIHLYAVKSTYTYKIHSLLM